MKNFVYKTSGICAKEITISISEGIINSVQFERGCEGNLQGISKLVEGMHVREVVKRLKGINCKDRGTSCPDQLSAALESILDKCYSDIA